MAPEKTYKRDEPTKRGLSCTCSCTTNLKPIAGFEPDPANPGQFLWTLKNGRTGLVEVECPTSSSSTSCFCSEDILQNRTTVAPNQALPGYPGKLNSTVAAGGRTIDVVATAVGKALLIVNVNQMTIECRQPGPPGVPGPNPLISTNTASCGGTSKDVDVIP